MFSRNFLRAAKINRRLTRSITSKSTFSSKSFNKTAFFAGTAGLFTGYSILRLFDQSTNRISCDAQPTPATIDTIQPKTQVSPFPKTISIEGSKYSVLGVGVKTISFLSFHVYAAGIYLADEDREKAKQVIESYGQSKDDIEKQLMDSVVGPEIVYKLFASGVRVLLRIVPARNTDLGHLRDGFVRAITGHAKFKEENANPSFGDGINELRQAFGRKLSVKKDTILHLLKEKNGSLKFSWFRKGSDVDGTKPEVLGTVTKPAVSDLLIGYYLAGKKVSCEDARREVVKSLTGL